MSSSADHIYEGCLATFGLESPERRKRRFDLTHLRNALFGFTYMCASEIFVIHGANVIRGPPYIHTYQAAVQYQCTQQHFSCAKYLHVEQLFRQRTAILNRSPPLGVFNDADLRNYTITQFTQLNYTSS